MTMVMIITMIMMVRLLKSKLITLHRGMTRGLSECRICTEYDTRIEYDGWVYLLTQVCQRNTCDSRIEHGDPCMTREWHERHEDDTDLLPLQHLRRQKRETMALTKSHKLNKAEPELYKALKDIILRFYKFFWLDFDSSLVKKMKMLLVKVVTEW